MTDMKLFSFYWCNFLNGRIFWFTITYPKIFIITLINTLLVLKANPNPPKLYFSIFFVFIRVDSCYIVCKQFWKMAGKFKFSKHNWRFWQFEDFTNFGGDFETYLWKSAWTNLSFESCQVAYASALSAFAKLTPNF